VAVALAILLAGSRVANYFGFILTSYLLSAVGAVATIAIVVLFQSEIRRALAHMNPSRWLERGGGRGNRLDSASIVAEAAFSLAERRKGALVVIPRWDDVFDYVTAGTIVEARLSLPLLDAIFTSSSPLHDGAVVVRDGRVLRAGVVLPLATENADPTHGTRHRAALGLAGATDALVVCVSEERGSVCLAHDDTLEVVPDKAELRAALQLLGNIGSRRGRIDPATKPSRFAGPLAYLAIFTGVVVAWAGLALDRSQAVTRVVPLEIRGVTETISVDPPRQNSVAVELRSSRRELDLLPPGAIEAYVELPGNTLGARQYRVHARAPAGVEITSLYPESVLVSTRPRPREAWPPGPAPGPTASPRGETAIGKRRAAPTER
jgi:uncharacterized protein (TIGR00159 family)